MNTGKAIRRYSRWKYSAKWGKYFAHWSVAVPVAVALVMGFMGVMIGLIYLIYFLLDGAFFGSPNPLGGNSLLTGEHSPQTSPGASLLISAELLLIIWFLLRWLLRFLEQEDEDAHFLNPLPPEENSPLPDGEILVRASVPTPEIQHAALLRVATQTAEIPPEQLLRTANDRG